MAVFGRGPGLGLGLGAKVPGLGVCVSEGCCGSCLLPTGP